MTTIKVNISRALPVINSVSLGDETYCSPSDTKSATATGTYATSFIWTPSGGARVNGQTTAQNTSSSVSISAVSNGSFELKAYSSVCQVASTNSISKYTYYGTPTITGAQVNGYPPSTPTYINNPAFLAVFPNNYLGMTCTWAVSNGTGSVYGNNLTAEAYANSFVIIKATLSNVCGTGDSYFFYLQQNGSFLYSVAPNPATDRKVRVTFADKAIAQELLKSMVLYNEKQEVAASLSNESLKAGTANMQSGELALDASKAEHLLPAPCSG